MPQRLNPDGPSGSLFQGSAGGVRLDLSRRNATGKYDISLIASSIREVFGEAAKKRKTEKEAQAEALGVEVYTAQQDAIRAGQDVGGKLAKLTERVNKHPIAQEPFMRGVAKAKSERGFDELTMKLNPLTETFPVTDENGAPLPMEQITAQFMAAANEIEASVSYLADLQGDPYVGEQTRTALESQKFAFLAEVQKRAAGANVEWVQNALGHRVTMRLQEGIKGTTSEEGVAAMRQTLSEVLQDARKDNVPNATNVVVGAGMAYIEKMLSTDGGSEAALAAIETLSEFEVNGARVDLDPQWSGDLAKYEQQAHEQENRAGARELETLRNYAARAEILLAAFLGTDENVARMLRGEREKLREEATAALAQAGLNDPSLAGLVDTAFDELTRGFTERTGPVNPESARAYDAAVLDINTSVGELMSFTNIGPEREANRLQDIARRQNWLRVTQAGQSFIQQELGVAGAVDAAVKSLGSDASVAAQDIGSRIDNEFYDALAEHAKNVIVPAGLSPAAEYEALRKFSREQGPIYRKKLADELGALRSQVQDTRTQVRQLVGEGNFSEARGLLQQRETSLDPGVIEDLSVYVARAGNTEFEVRAKVEPSGEYAQTFIAEREMAFGSLFGAAEDGAPTDQRALAFRTALEGKLAEIHADLPKLRGLIDPLSGIANDAEVQALFDAAAAEAGAEAFGNDWGVVETWRAHSSKVAPFAQAVASSSTPARTYFSAQEFSSTVAPIVGEALSTAPPQEAMQSVLLALPRMRAAGASDAELFDAAAPFALTPDAVMRGSLEVQLYTSFADRGEPSAALERYQGVRPAGAPDARSPGIPEVVPLPAQVDFYTTSLGSPESVRRWYTRGATAEDDQRRADFMARVQALGGPASFDTLMAIQEQIGLHVIRDGQSTRKARIR